MRVWISGLPLLLLGLGAAPSISAAAAPLTGAPTFFQCGPDVRLETRFAPDLMEVTLRGGIFRLQQAMSASGARYTGTIAGLPAEFWNKGQEATVRIGQAELPHCVEVGASPAAAAAAGLEGGRWRIIDLAGQQPAPDTMDMQFEDGRIAGRGGCNRYSGAYRLEAGRIMLEDSMISTRIACLGPQMEQENLFFRLMRGAVAYRILPDGQLELTAADGSRLLARRD